MLRFFCMIFTCSFTLQHHVVVPVLKYGQTESLKVIFPVSV